jgi:hypothetical protein
MAESEALRGLEGLFGPAPWVLARLIFRFIRAGISDISASKLIETTFSSTFSNIASD